MKLRTSILTGLMGFSTLASAEEIKENVNVNVNVDNAEGIVTIIKEINGETQTIERSFIADADTDVEAMVDSILAENEINLKENGTHKEFIRLVNQGDKDLVWVQKNNNVEVNLIDGHAQVLIKKNNNGTIEIIEESFDLENNEDINVFIDGLMLKHGIETGDAKIHKKIIKLDKKFTHIEDDKPRMGFMANVKDSGWEIISVVPGSGAAEAGLIKGDLVISIDGQSTARRGLGLTEFIAMDHAEGHVSDVVVLRNNKEIKLEVTAKVLDSPDIIMELNGDRNWFTSSGKDFKFNSGDLDDMFAGLHVDVEHLEKMITGLGEHDIHVVTTGDADAYFFAGSKMNQWLGNNHHFSTMTETLGSYFGTSEGVLVLEVDKNNRLGLQDGDVIIAINGTTVNSPKEVIKTMTNFKTDDAFEIEIIRQKETLYLES